MIEWPGLTFPPINLWSMPYMSDKKTVLFYRFSDMYCSNEIAMMYKRGSEKDLSALKKAEKEFYNIWVERGSYWEVIN